MLFSLALLFLSALVLARVCQQLHLPRLLGMLSAGLLLGPSVLNLLDANLLMIAPDLRQVALVIILFRAGLTLNLKQLKQAGLATLFLSFVPALFEIGACILFAPTLLNITLTDAALLGTVLAAVSPAVIVPQMITLTENGYGQRRRIPQMIMAASSVDDIFVIILFSALLGIQGGERFSTLTLLNIPISILTGIVTGSLIGYLLQRFFKRFHIRDTIKVLLLISLAFLLMSVEQTLKPYIAFSALLAVVSLGISLLFFYPVLADRLSTKFSKLWVGAELLLFVLVGAVVDISYAASIGIQALTLLILILLIRMLGVFVATIKSKLTLKERFFCMLAFIPKATVQAAIGSIPLALNLPAGEKILSMAVISILLTAPIGAFLIEKTHKYLLDRT